MPAHIKPVTFTFSDNNQGSLDASGVETDTKNEPQHPYRIQKTLLTPAERSFYGVLKQAVGGQYEIFSKVRVADILTPISVNPPNRSAWQKAQNKIHARHFDFALCNKDDLSVVSILELDDKSHRTDKAKKRDDFLNKACESAGLRMIRVPAKRAYVIMDIQRLIASASS